MKKTTLFLSLLFCVGIMYTYNNNPNGSTSTAFITTWKTTNPNESITIPTVGTGYNYNVDWGDGSTATGQTGDATHIYTTAGTYTVKITGSFPRIYFNNLGNNKDKIMTIAQWGTNAWASMGYAFYGCSNLTSTATDAPDLSGVTTMRYMFASATAFNGAIGSWNTATVTDMRSMFQSASNVSAFNADISSWNTAAVTDMSYMFDGASSFNQNIGTWNTATVTDMRSMFQSASAFNQNIGTWNTAAVTNMNSMFDGASSFIKI